MRIGTIASGVMVIMGLCVSAMAGTTTIDFTQGMGNLMQIGGGGGITIDSGCYAVINGTPTYLISSGSEPASSSGDTAITMNIRPLDIEDYNYRVGVVFRDAADTNHWGMCTTNDLGELIIRTWDARTAQTASNMYPAANSNNGFTLTYYASEDRVRVTVYGLAT